MVGRLWAAALILGLCACGQSAAHSPPRSEPADARLAQLFDHSCKACHTVKDSGAPLAHDEAAWDERWTKGLATLRDHAITGFGAMPAGGQCAACTPDDYEKLIRFMADRENGS